MFDLGKQKIDIECPECNRKVSVTLDQVAEEQIVTCPIGHKIQLQDKDNSAREGIKDINKSFKDLERTIKNFGK
jgi:hypothetical protein